jgi:hypothetical protein
MVELHQCRSTGNGDRPRLLIHHGLDIEHLEHPLEGNKSR